MPVVVLFVLAGLVAATTDSRWATIHLLLAGATVLLISAVSLMLTVTWSAAPAPRDRTVVVQRTCIAAGVAILVSGRQAATATWVPVLGAVLYGIGLAQLAVLVVTTVRRGVERRYDVPVAGYAVAAGFGIVGAVLGTSMLVGATSADLRDAHRTVNLLGLVGMVIFATLPFFTATVVRSKMKKAATPKRLVALLAAQTATLLVAVIGVAAAAPAVAATGLAVYAAGLVATMALMPAPTRRQFDWAGPRLVAMWAGTTWWVVVVAVAAGQTATGASPFADPWLGVLMVAAYGQIVWGSLAYLLPVLRGGGHEMLGAGFALTRSWEALVAVNVAGVALVADLTPVVVLAIGIWALDTGVRFALLARRRSGRERVSPS